jgi:hypothetical protein
MTTKPVPLERYFSLIHQSETDFDERDFSSFFGGSKRAGWLEVANNFPGVVAIDVILIDLTVRESKSVT